MVMKPCIKFRNCGTHNSTNNYREQSNENFSKGVISSHNRSLHIVVTVNPMNTDSEGGIQCRKCLYIGVSVLIELNLEKTGWANFFPRNKANCP